MLLHTVAGENPILVIFCADPLHPRQVDDAYASELATAERARNQSQLTTRTSAR